MLFLYPFIGREAESAGQAFPPSRTLAPFASERIPKLCPRGFRNADNALLTLHIAFFFRQNSFNTLYIGLQDGEDEFFHILA
jgi:hypothetical protein